MTILSKALVANHELLTAKTVGMSNVKNQLLVTVAGHSAFSLKGWGDIWVILAP